MKKIMTESTLKLEKKVKINGKIRLMTGMHIGGTDIGLAIGGADKIVVRNTIDKVPYIPGSSLKGKMRSLIEKIEGKVNFSIKDGKYKGEICTDVAEPLVQLFGIASDNPHKNAPTRLMVRDAKMNNESVKTLENLDQTDMYLTEIKSENYIDRLTSAANPRSFERVPAGVDFDFEMIVDIYNVDKENDMQKKLLDIVKQGMKLVELDYIGGHGSRGYGQIKFHDIKIQVKTAENYKDGKDWDENHQLEVKFDDFKI